MKSKFFISLAVSLGLLCAAQAGAAQDNNEIRGGISKPASPQIHAMIMAIGAYHEGIPQLGGVKFDTETARQIAHRMGVPDSNIHVYQNEELTLEGMKKAFDDLEASVQQDDQVFIYYSGHGGRQLVKEDDRGERCAESLITVDGVGFIDTEIEARLKRLSQKAQKLIVLIDACHSGGVTTRAIGGKPQSTEFTPKYWHGKGGMDACTKPVNVVTRGIKVDMEVPGSGANNYTYIAAARDNEISLDQPGKGGVASQAWLDCMNGAAVDLDGSGSLSAEEIRACAQDKIDRKLANAKGVLPHHVSITGNTRAIVGFAEKGAAEQQQPSAAPAAASAKPQAAQTKPVVSPGKTKKANPLATLEDIYANRDDRRLVELNSLKKKLKIDQDSFEFTLKSSHAGYVYLLMVGSDGTSFDLLFPNQLDKKNEIAAGETLKLPHATWELAAGGPAGKDTLLAIVAESPRDFSNIGMQPAGPFSVIDAQAVPGGTRDIQLVTTNSSNANTGECVVPKERNLTIQKHCSNAYGAALVSVEEVN